MAKETPTFETEQSEELYNWINKEYPPEKLAKSPLFVTECIGILKTLKHLGLNYNWIDARMNTLNMCLAIYAL